VCVIWLVLTAIGITIGIVAPRHLLPAFDATSGTDVLRTVVFFTVLAAPVAGFVYAVAATSLLGRRHPGSADEPPPEDGAPLRGNRPTTMAWLAVSGALVVVMLVWGVSIWSNQQTSAPHALRVRVTGQQWLWNFSYPGTSIESRTLVLPVDRPVVFEVTSLDVTHGFWPVDLGTQVDANPNEITVLRTTPNRLGRFEVRCSQICGLYHSLMDASGEVVTPSAFSRWLQSEGATPAVASQVARVDADR
jgi:cytochrome c oxidase subunit 2